LVPAGTKVFEWITGGLDNGGETVQLDRPGAVDALNVQQYVRIDRVNYSDAAPWPATADGGGPSLTRLVETEYGNDFINWVAAAPSPGSATAPSEPDSDGDGIPDTYEVAHGMNPNDPTDAALDPDGDGQSNRAEYLAGTDPRNAASSLVASVVTTATPGLFAVHFNAIAGKTYTVKFKNDLSETTWMKLGDVPAHDADAFVDVADPGSTTQTHRYYKVVTPAEP